MDITFVQFLLICAVLCWLCWAMATSTKRASEREDLRVKISNGDLTIANNNVGIEKARYAQALVQACWVNMPQEIENHRKSLEVEHYALHARSVMLQHALNAGVSEDVYKQTYLANHQLKNDIEWERERTRNQIAINHHQGQMDVQKIQAQAEKEVRVITAQTEGTVKSTLAQYGLGTGEVIKQKLLNDGKVDHSRQILDVQDDKYWREQARAKLAEKEAQKKAKKAKQASKETTDNAKYTKRPVGFNPPINTNRRDA